MDKDLHKNYLPPSNELLKFKMHTIQEVEFTNPFFTKQKIYFHNRLAILIGRHCSGKTTVLETLADGFHGGKAHFFVNNQKVTTSDFQVMYLKDHFSLKEEIKLNKTSHFRHHILKTINQHLLTQHKYQKVVTDIKQLALAIEKVIAELFSKNLHALTNENILLKFSVDKINLEHIIDELLEIHLFDQTKEIVLKESGFNQFLLRMVVFNVLKTAIDEEDDKRPVVVLFDNPELYTTLKTSTQLNNILQQLMQKHNFYLVFASNSVEYLTSFNHSIQSLNWLSQNQVVHFDKCDNILQKGVAMYQFLLNDRYQNWSSYSNDFNRVFDVQTDLQREWENFYRFEYRYFLKGFFLDQIIFNEVDDVRQSQFTSQIQIDSHQLRGNYSLSLSSICLLVSFFSDCHFNYSFAKNLLTSRPKLSTFLP